MKWTNEQKSKILYDRINDPSIFEGISYKKLLIFISGNLDEAYTMSSETSETDVDADLFHAFSKKITMIDIKKILRERFRPEQISRLGNTHIIYPSLSRSSYKEIINRYVDSILDRIQQIGVDIEVDQSVKDCIYRNGVFPTQGVRPVFSTINAMLGNTIPFFVMKAVELLQKKIKISYENDHLVSNIGKEEIKQKIDRKIDLIRTRTDQNKRCLVAVHECGHALVFGLLFKSAPLQVVGNAAAVNPTGWVGVPSLGNSKQQIINNVCVVIAGFCAEEIVFGKRNVCTGSADDLSFATGMITRMLREWGLGEVVSRLETESANHPFNHDLSHTNDEIEKILQEQKRRATEILVNNKKIFVDMVDELIKKEQMSSHGFQKFMKKHGIEVNIIDPAVTIYEDYSAMFAAFLEKSA